MKIETYEARLETLEIKHPFKERGHKDILEVLKNWTFLPKLMTFYTHFFQWLGLGNYNCHVLHSACKYGNLELLKDIFENPDFDIDFNVVDTNGDTSFHIACFYGQFEVVKFMLENSNKKGIDILKKNKFQYTPEDYARRRGHKDISEVLKIWTRLMKVKTYKARLEALKIKHPFNERGHMDILEMLENSAFLLKLGFGVVLFLLLKETFLVIIKQCEM
mgnify:CR=1 FL=1